MSAAWHGVPCCCVLQRQQQAELLRMLRAEEAQARFEYIRSRAAEVSEQDKIKREELARRLEVSRTAAMSRGLMNVSSASRCATMHAWKQTPVTAWIQGNVVTACQARDHSLMIIMVYDFVWHCYVCRPRWSVLMHWQRSVQPSQTT